MVFLELVVDASLHEHGLDSGKGAQPTRTQLHGQSLQRNRRVRTASGWQRLDSRPDLLAEELLGAG
jgi:hypothetical protein